MPNFIYEVASEAICQPVSAARGSPGTHSPAHAAADSATPVPPSLPTVPQLAAAKRSMEAQPCVAILCFDPARGAAWPALLLTQLHCALQSQGIQHSLQRSAVAVVSQPDTVPHGKAIPSMAEPTLYLATPRANPSSWHLQARISGSCAVLHVLGELLGAFHGQAKPGCLGCAPGLACCSATWVEQQLLHQAHAVTGMATALRAPRGRRLLQAHQAARGSAASSAMLQAGMLALEKLVQVDVIHATQNQLPGDAPQFIHGLLPGAADCAIAVAYEAASEHLSLPALAHIAPACSGIHAGLSVLLHALEPGLAIPQL